MSEQPSSKKEVCPHPTLYAADMFNQPQPWGDCLLCERDTWKHEASQRGHQIESLQRELVEANRHASEVEAEYEKRMGHGFGTAPEPSAEQAEREDMENIGRAFMERLHEAMPGYSWCDSPVEVIYDLINERDEARASQPPSAWQPIETLKHNDGDSQMACLVAVLAACGAADHFVGEANLVEGHGWFWAGNDPTDSWGGQIYPTHWQPLPAPPCTGTTKEGAR